MSNTSHTLNQRNEASLSYILRNLNTNLDSIFNEASQSNRMILNNPLIQEILLYSQSEDYSDSGYLDVRNRLFTLLTGYSIYNGVYFASFYNCDGHLIFTNENASFKIEIYDLFSNEWIKSHKDLIDSREVFIVPPVYIGQNQYSTFRPYMIIRPLTDIEESRVSVYVTVFAEAGLIDAAVSESFTQINVSAEPQINSIRLSDTDGVIITSTNAAEVGERLTGQSAVSFNSVERYGDTLRYRSKFTGFTLTLEINPNYTSGIFRESASLLALILLVLFSVMGLAIVAVLRVKMRPLERLTESMEQVGKGHFELTLDCGNIKDDDIKTLYEGFNGMTKKIDSLITNVYRQQLDLKSAQLKSLTFQINPHFLYNTLQTIEVIAELKDLPEIQTITICLSKMFRYNLQPDNMVPLREELAHLSSYFEIEKIRFRGDIEFKFEVTSSLTELSVPKFILQPIAENAIIHGFKGSPVPHVIVVRAEIAEPGQLWLSVIDNGVGISASKLTALNRILSSRDVSPAEENGRESIGIVNVHKRIVHCCGPRYGVNVVSDGIGTDVILRLPDSNYITEKEALTDVESHDS
ncbi:MAG: histidine kinase [Clostridiales bacterium]|jgi:sensor histidine kinase YesM|nr:histidine kinase [Clostridiales bacterium]